MPPKKPAKLVDNDFIGPHCSSVGITKATLKAGYFPSVTVTNGMVIELYRYVRHKDSLFNVSTVCDWLHSLGIERSLNLQLCIESLAAKREVYRRGKKVECIHQLESQPFSPNECVTQPPTKSSSGVQDACTQTANENLTKEDNALKHEVKQKEKHLQTLTANINKLKEELRCEQATLSHFSKENVKRRDARAEEARHQREQFRKERDNALKELEQLKEKTENLQSVCDKQSETIVLQEATISRLLTREAELGNTVSDLKEEKVKLQKRLFHYKGQASKAASRVNSRCSSCEDYAQKLQVEKERVAELEDELDIAKGKEIITMQGHTFTDDIRLCVIELTGLEVSTEKVRPVIQTVAKHIFKYTFTDKDLPHKNTCQAIVDEGHVLAKRFIAKRLGEASGWGIHKDGTSRKKKKILDTTVCTDKGEMFSLGFSTVASETGRAIADDCADKITEVIKEGDVSLSDVMSHLSYTMSDRAGNEKKSNTFLSQWRDEVAPTAVTPIDNLFCMAHVLLGFHSYSIKALKEHQKTVSQTGVLGRDLHPGFKRYKCDAAAERLCSTASDVFAPVGNHLGARDIWEAYCLEHGIKSEIKNYKDNRFNGLFQVSAAVTYHRDDFHKILSQIKDPNKKLQALKADLEDSNLTNIIHALGILYVKITGPFWNLIQSTSHTKLKPILKQLRSDIQEIKKNPALISTELPSLAGFALDTPLRKIVPDKLTKELDIILQCLCKAFLSTMDKQLHDIFEESEESVSATSNAAFAPSTNLICEHHFGDLDSSQRRRPGASMHHHSSVQMLKRNRKGMSKWLCSMPSAERTAVLKSARSSSQTLRKKHQKQYYSELSKSSLKLSASRSTAKALLKKAVRGNKKTQQLTLPDTSTVKVNQWVIAAYQDNWYPGIIKAVDVTNFTIDFARRCNKVGNFQWPNGGDIQSVEKHFIISTNVDIFTATKGRVWSIRGVDKIEKVFRQFVKKYFN